MVQPKLTNQITQTSESGHSCGINLCKSYDHADAKTCQLVTFHMKIITFAFKMFWILKIYCLLVI